MIPHEEIVPLLKFIQKLLYSKSYSFYIQHCDVQHTKLNWSVVFAGPSIAQS